LYKDSFCNYVNFKTMSRGSNNKAGTSGQGASNQSNQGFGQAANRGKSTHGTQTGEKASVPQKKKADQSANRNTSLDKEEP
jgi:hypothetical protein